MKPDKKKYLYVCDNCDHEFYMRKKITDCLVECAQCGEKSAYCFADSFDEDVDIENFGDTDLMGADLMSEYGYDDYS